MSTFKIAGVQMDIAITETARNLSRILSAVEETTRHGARLTVFPECAVSGYCFESLEEARSFAVSLSAGSGFIEPLTEVCRRTDSFVVVGLLERDSERVFNACILVGPTGLLGTYRKLHLPMLGVDRFTTPGEHPPQVFNAGEVKLGMNICYDGSFPEASRVMALAGAELIVLPTNWPPAASCFAQYTINTRAMENHVYYMSVNRIGSERGFSFMGTSRICDPIGNTIAAADHEEEAILYADIDPAWARNKHIIRSPGHEIHRWNDRRPELYGRITEPVERR